MIAAALAYIPVLTPIQAFHTWWYLMLVPLSFGIAMIYKAIRIENLRDYWKEVGIMTVQIVLAMIGLAIVLTIVVQWMIPALPV